MARSYFPFQGFGITFCLPQTTISTFKLSSELISLYEFCLIQKYLD